MSRLLSKHLLSVTLLASMVAIGGCVSTTPPQIDNCEGDSMLINGECVGVDEYGNPK
ncbi:hypothetical protein [Ahrensia kielensis]|uniref:Uncharacterized protein n=1 Tax=Ahrensia kielensis TaxID=76980 RepID=A0ABU9TAQ5_9HYPH|nr:hypothetical protein [Ahrensia kielensis]